jgi:MurNAc alpha-1-phosphate uridylyltransferase
VQQHWREALDAHLVLVPNPMFNMGGDFSLSSDQIVSYPEADGQTFTFSGLSVMRPEIFAMYSSASEKFPIRDVLANGIKAGCVSGEVYRGEWWDVGTIGRLEALNSLISGKEVSLEKKPRVRLS